MSIAQTQPLVDSLVRAKIPKQTATNLIDFIETNQSQELKQDVSDVKKDIHWLKKDNEIIKKDIHWLKKDNEIIKKDIHWLKWAISATLSLLIGLAGVMVYLHSDLKFDVNQRIDKIDQQMDKMDQRIDKIDQRMDKIESKLDRLLRR